MKPPPPPSARLGFTLYDPPPAAPGLKLDWRSPVGQSGVLLEWTSATGSVDAGVPPDVAMVLAAALGRVALVVGCTVELPAEVGTAWATIGAGAFAGAQGCRIPGRLWSAARKAGIVASRDAGVIATFFDQALFDWSQESQLLVLAEPDALPRIDRAFVDDALALPIAIDPPRLATAGVIGFIRPGVDGGMAGVYVPGRSQRQTVLDALAADVRAAGGGWTLATGDTHWSARRTTLTL